MDIDPFSMLEVSLQEPDNEEGDSDCMEVEPSSGSQNSTSFQSNDSGRSVQLHPLFNSKDHSNNPLNAVMANKERLAVTTKDEERYRKKTFSSINVVLKKRLHCTVCDAHIGAHMGLKNDEIEHPLLKVLVCSRCTNKYRLMDFPLTPEGRDIRCRWCTSSSTKERPLRFCKACPFAFCEMCIYRNLPLDELAIKDNWVCFVCNIKDLWPSRALLWALRVLIDTNRAMNEDRRWLTDQATCCNKNPIAGAQRPRNRVITLNRLPPTGMQYRPPMQTNGHMKSISRPPQMKLNAVRTLNLQKQQIFSSVRPQQSQRTAPMKNRNQQVFETKWLTDKIRLICNSLMTLHSNLARLSSGIPDVENKYSIKSKLISMVSLLNISATQLQKASKDMESESKRILDKNIRVNKLPEVEVVKTISSPDVKPKRKALELSPIITMTQTIKADEDDPVEDAKPAVTPSEMSKIVTKPCYVRLERLSITDLVKQSEVPKEEPQTQKAEESQKGERQTPSSISNRRKSRKRKRKTSSGSRSKLIRGENVDLDGDSQTGLSEYSLDETSRDRQSEQGDNAKIGDEVAPNKESESSQDVGINQEQRLINVHSEERNTVENEPLVTCNSLDKDVSDDQEAESSLEKLNDEIREEDVGALPTVPEHVHPATTDKEDSPEPIESSSSEASISCVNEQQTTLQKDIDGSVDDNESSVAEKSDHDDERIEKSDENLTDAQVESPIATDSPVPSPSVTPAPPESQQSEKMKKLLQRMQNNKM